MISQLSLTRTVIKEDSVLYPNRSVSVETQKSDVTSRVSSILSRLSPPRLSAASNISSMQSSFLMDMSRQSGIRHPTELRQSLFPPNSTSIRSSFCIAPTTPRVDKIKRLSVAQLLNETFKSSKPDQLVKVIEDDLDQSVHQLQPDLNVRTPTQDLKL